MKPKNPTTVPRPRQSASKPLTAIPTPSNPPARSGSLIRLPIADLTPNAANPRKITDKRKAQLRKSLEQFGNLSPITWNKTTGRVIGGNQRLEGYRDLGHSHVDVWVVELDEAREKAAVVALNNHAGEWDNSKLEAILRELQATDIDLQLTGFEDLVRDVAGLKTTVKNIDGQSDSSGNGDSTKTPPSTNAIVMVELSALENQSWQAAKARLQTKTDKETLLKLLA